MPDKPAGQQKIQEDLLTGASDTIPPTPRPVFPLDNGDDTNLCNHYFTDLYDQFSTDLYGHFSTALVAEPEPTFESDDPFMGFGSTPFPPEDAFPDHD